MGPRAFEAFMGRWGVAASAVQGLTSKRKPSARRERFIAAVAAAYHHHVQRGSRRPVADVADDFGISRSTARDVIHEARRRGFLSGTQQGVAGGSITDLALRVLAAEVDEEDA